ncbi:MAG: endolytic transglycosylase MltG [Acidobacteriota bacterium]|nr:endolytic transglycosylase MltG [Acidobacteriota bacterium]
MILRALVALALASVPIATGAGAAWWGWRAVHEPYRGWSGNEVTFEVETGSNATQVLAALAEAGIIGEAGLARLYLLYVLEDTVLQAGEYRFAKPASTLQVLEVLTAGRVVTHPVTVIEGLTLEETADTLSAAGFGDRDRLIGEMSDKARIADLDPDAGNLEGYLFPDTYAFPKGATEADIVDAMVVNFRHKLALAQAAGEQAEVRSVRDLVTLASIVEKEALLDAERPLIAGVYSHRLRRRIPLSADPTVIFAMKLLGTWSGNLRRPDLRMDHPYNTYVKGGLPPGPICSPGEASLLAAAAPEHTTHLYFVSRNDGTNVFADTLSEHNRNVNKWQKQYWARKWRAK